MKLRPLDDGVVIKPLEAQEKTAGGIFLPDTAKEKPQIGKVIATGPGRLLENGKRSPMHIKKNDEVIFPKYIGSDFESEGTKYVIIKERDILGIVEK